MSSVIAATTAALRDLLRSRIIQTAPDLADLVVTAQAPHRARGDGSGTQLNLFLFDAPVDRAFINRAGRERGPAAARDDAAPVFGVTLNYLLTAYDSEDDDGDLTCHRVLGAAIAVLEGERLLEDIVPGGAPIVRLDMTALDMAALWTSFQTPFRLSAAYAIGPVPIESA